MSPDPADLRLSSYAFDLPESFIAQRPVERRGESRMLVVERAEGRKGGGAALTVRTVAAVSRGAAALGAVVQIGPRACSILPTAYIYQSSL